MITLMARLLFHNLQKSPAGIEESEERESGIMVSGPASALYLCLEPVPDPGLCLSPLSCPSTYQRPCSRAKPEEWGWCMIIDEPEAARRNKTPLMGH